MSILLLNWLELYLNNYFTMLFAATIQVKTEICVENTLQILIAERFSDTLYRGVFTVRLSQPKPPKRILCQLNEWMFSYYMTSSMSGQDESNPALWLATRAGKMELSWPLGTVRRVPQEKFPESHIINPSSTKLVRSRWLDIGLVLFLRVYGPRLRLGP